MEEAGYPLILKLVGTKCLVVGGGPVAERKTASLLAAGAKVTLLAPALTANLAGWAAEGKILWQERNVQTGDVAESGARLVFAACGDRSVNRSVCAEAEEAGCLSNNVDEPEEGSFTVPAVVRRGDLVIAVSTGGASPTAARTLAREIADRYGEDYATYTAFLREVREHVKASTADKELRRRLLKEAAIGEPALAAIREGTFEVYRETFLRRIREEAGS
ncbi:NAD(P)-dependent oxidoreductase [Gorillibacterium sp. CAU 1737]|uniref:precorrin-2 dehydrogenase/sirohydrochlorin ferrochelatase family protein n=1 Tax=Gorillibacterium sp. CAU 1737 TaxID=3140362 RepID=UPI00326091B7